MKGKLTLTYLSLKHKILNNLEKNKITKQMDIDIQREYSGTVKLLNMEEVWKIKFVIEYAI